METHKTSAISLAAASLLRRGLVCGPAIPGKALTTLLTFKRRMGRLAEYVILCQVLVISYCLSSENGRWKTIVLKETLTIDSSRGSPFVQVGEVITDTRNNIYVTDEYQYKVKKFDSCGHFLESFGTRGKLPGQFEAGPYKLGCMQDTLAICGVGSHTVQLYASPVQHLRDVHLPGVVVDFCFTTNGSIYAATIQPPFNFEKTLALYSQDGALLSSVPLKDGAKDPILDMTTLCTDASDNLIVVFLFINKILIYNREHHCIADFKIPGLPKQAIQEQQLADMPSMPDNLFSDVAVDTGGNIFILAGLLAKHPNRDLYVTDYRGTLRTVVLLPDQSGIIYLDRKGSLFTREKQRSVVRKYKLSYQNF